MGFSTGLAVPFFLLVVTITCDKSLGQYGPWNRPQAYAVNDGMSNSNGDRSMGYGRNLASATSDFARNGGMAFDGTSSSAGTGGFSLGVANSGAGEFSAAAGSGPVSEGKSTGDVFTTGNGAAIGSRGGGKNGAWKPRRGRPRKGKPTIQRGDFSVKNFLSYVKNIVVDSYFKLSSPDSLNRVAKCSGLFKSAGFSPGSLYQAFFALYNEISARHDEMSFLEVGILAVMEMAFGIVTFLKSTPFAFLVDIDYVSLLNSLLGLMGCDSLCISNWATYLHSVFN